MMRLYVFACVVSLAGVCQAASVVSNGTGGGRWSEAQTWAGAIVPGNGDSVTIVAGDVVTFDVDMSAWDDGIAGLTCDGTMNCSTAAGLYCLKTSEDIGGTGAIHCGSEEAAYPSDCTMIFDFDANPSSFQCRPGLTLNLYCTEPLHPVATLSEAAAAGETELLIDTDVSDDIWTPGKTIRIDAVSGRLPDSEVHRIAANGVTPGTVTLDVGLADAKASGATVVLVTRNIRIIGSTDYAIRYLTGGVLRCEISNCTYAVGAASGSVVSGTISGGSYGVANSSGCTISGTISGCTYGVSNPSGCLVSATISGCSYGVTNAFGCTVSGAISGCIYGVNQGADSVLSGSITGCGSGIYGGSHTMRDAVLEGNTYDLRRVMTSSAHNTVFGSATESYEYHVEYVPLWTYVASHNHDGIADAFKAWTRGGIVVSDADTTPPGYVTSYRHMSTSSAIPCFRQEAITVGPNQTLEVLGKILILTSHSLWPPRLELIDVGADPLANADAAALASAVIPEPRGRYYWQDVTVRYTNTNATGKQIWIRCSAQQSGDEIYEVWDARLQ